MLTAVFKAEWVEILEFQLAQSLYKNH